MTHGLLQARLAAPIGPFPRFLWKLGDKIIFVATGSHNFRFARNPFRVVAERGGHFLQARFSFTSLTPGTVQAVPIKLATRGRARLEGPGWNNTEAVE
jgi:hypothetical protein